MTSTDVPRLTFVPAAGAWAMIAPASRFAAGLSAGCGCSFSPSGISIFCASNTLCALVRFGTTVCLGASRMIAATIAAATGATTASHHGSHDFCR